MMSDEEIEEIKKQMQEELASGEIPDMNAADGGGDGADQQGQQDQQPQQPQSPYQDDGEDQQGTPPINGNIKLLNKGNYNA